MRESRALDASIAAQLGHPDFESLKVGETAESDGVVFSLTFAVLQNCRLCFPTWSFFGSCRL